jgi:hypothetical protein
MTEPTADPTSSAETVPYSPPERVRSRKPLIFAGVIAAVLIVGVVLTVVLVGAGGGSPQSVAQDYLTAAKSGDLTKLQSLTCDQYKASVTKASAVTAAEGISDALANVNFQVTGVQQTGDSTAVAQVKVSYGAAASVTIPLPMVKEHGSWKVCTG